MKGYKLWDPIKSNMVVNINVIFDEQSMLKHSDVTVIPDTDVESSSQDKIQVDIEEPPLSPRHIVAQQQDEPDSDSGGVQDYTLVCDREPHSIAPPVRYGFEDLTTYALLTNSRYLSTF